MDANINADFDHPVVDSHCLTPKRTLDEFYPLSHDNEILMYNAICILNNRIIEAEYWHFKLLDKIKNNRFKAIKEKK